MVIDDVAHPILVDSDHRGEQTNGSIDVLGMLANDGDAVRVTVLDKPAPRGNEHQASGRTKGQGALVVFLGHLVKLGVLDDLQHPEADGQHREDHDHAVLQRRQAHRDLPPVFNYGHSRYLASVPSFGFPTLSSNSSPLCPSTLDSTWQPFDQPKRQDAYPSIAQGLAHNRRVRVPETPQIQQHVESHEYDRVQHGRQKKHDEPWNRPGHKKGGRKQPRQKAHNRLRQAANSDDAARKSILRQAGRGSCQQAGDRTEAERRVHNDHETQVDGDRPSNDESGQGGLKRQRQRYRQNHQASLHSWLRSAASVPVCVTTSTASNDRKSSAGFTTMRLYALPLFSISSRVQITTPSGNI